MKEEAFISDFWQEEPEQSDPFQAHRYRAHGFDVYGNLLGKVGLCDYLLLLLRGEPAPASERKLFECLTIAIANHGPRDLSINAAMNAGVGGSTAAACLSAALAVGAGQYSGAHEVYRAMLLWPQLGRSVLHWDKGLGEACQESRADIWLPMEHIAGFNPNSAICATPIQQTLAQLKTYSGDGWITFLHDNRSALENRVGYALNWTGVATAAFLDLQLSAEQAEMLYLFLRLPGAIVHALEQKQLGWREFPFYKDAVHLHNDPGTRGPLPDMTQLRPEWKA